MDNINSFHPGDRILVQHGHGKRFARFVRLAPWGKAIVYYEHNGRLSGPIRVNVLRLSRHTSRLERARRKFS